jgi:tRNA pseudouridine55 synthase
LRRPSVSPFDEQDLVTLDALQTMADNDPAELDRRVIPVDQAIADWPALHLSAAEARDVRQGQSIAGGAASAPGLVRLYDEAAGFLGIGEVLGDGRVAPKRLFVAAGGSGG